MAAILLLCILLVFILIVFYRMRSQWYIKYRQNLIHLNAEQIYHQLCCFEFPFESFYGINLAFYRTFVSPTIATVYTQTKTLQSETEKRVNDTDILVHAWFDYGLNSNEGRESFAHLNRIHGAFSHRTRNQDFVFILCCLIIDNIQLIDLVGWRRLNDIEKQAVFLFYEQVGEKMNLRDRPTSLEHAYTIVNEYIDSDMNSGDTEYGRVLTNAINTIVEKWYSALLPASLVRAFLSAIIYLVGGQRFHQKLGLKQPSTVTLSVLYTLANIRRYFMHFMPPRRYAHRLSDVLMKKNYMCPAAKSDFSQVGPSRVIATFGKNQAKHED